jgi:hypothetical protein
MTFNTGGWSPGKQSIPLPPSRPSTREYAAVLSAIYRSLVCSAGSSFARNFRDGIGWGTAWSPGAGGVANPEVHSRSGGSAAWGEDDPSESPSRTMSTTTV